MKRTSFLLFAALSASPLLPSCAPAEDSREERTGGASIGVATSALSNASDIATAIVEVRDSSNALVRSINLIAKPDAWRGELAGLPVGMHTLSAKLSDANGTVLYSTATPHEVMIQAGVTANVTLIASSPSQSYGNFVPNITGLSADHDPIRRGDVVTLTATAADLDNDPLTYSWVINGAPVDPNDASTTAAANAALMQAEMQEFETNVKPILSATCAGCHSGNPAVGPSYLVAPMYDTLIGFASGSLIGPTPETTRIYIKGAHAGPALTDSQKPFIYDWIVHYNAAKSAGASASPASTLRWTVPADTADTRLTVKLTVADNKGGTQTFERIYDFEIPSSEVAVELNNSPVVTSFTSSVGFVGPSAGVHDLTLSATDPDVGDTLTITSGAPGADSYPDCPGSFGTWTSSSTANGSQFKTTFTVDAGADFAALALHGYCSIRASVTDSKGIAGTGLLRVPVRTE